MIEAKVYNNRHGHFVVVYGGDLIKDFKHSETEADIFCAGFNEAIKFFIETNSFK